jgi:hypothetical protein
MQPASNTEAGPLGDVPLLPWKRAAQRPRRSPLPFHRVTISRGRPCLLAALTLGSYEASDRVTPESFLTYFARREAHLIADAPHAFAAVSIPGVAEVAAGIGVIGGAVLWDCKQT